MSLETEILFTDLLFFNDFYLCNHFVLLQAAVQIKRNSRRVWWAVLLPSATCVSVHIS